MRIPDFTFEPRGPEGIQQRISEIRARAGFNDFADTLNKQKMAGFAANTDPSGAKGSVNPLDPFGQSLNPTAAKVMDRAKINAYVTEIAQKENLEPDLINAIIEQESNFDTFAKSGSGALGLMQLMPSTAKELGVKDPFDPAQNIAGGAKYMRKLIDQFQDVRLALAAYNAGPQRVIKAGGIPDSPETQQYVARIMKRIGG